jgi:hypothetical protein
MSYFCALLSYHFIVLHEHHVISTQSSDEDDTGHTFEAMDPLLPLRPLTTHIEHSAERNRDMEPPNPVFWYPKPGRGAYLLLNDTLASWIDLLT